MKSVEIVKGVRAVPLDRAPKDYDVCAACDDEYSQHTGGKYAGWCEGMCAEVCTFVLLEIAAIDSEFAK